MAFDFFDSISDFLEDTKEAISDTVEDLTDSICEKFEDTGEEIIESVERFGRKVERRGDALLGCGDYEYATTGERAACLFGCHDNQTFHKQNTKKAKGLEPGDIISVNRGIYTHFGVYAEKNKVIHYTSEDSDIGDNSITITSFSRFMKNSNTYHIIIFPDHYGEPSSVSFNYENLFYPRNHDNLFNTVKKSKKYILYSNEETIERAYSRLGESDYNILSNNCEHFAIWCKTGVSESHQVNAILKETSQRIPF